MFILIADNTKKFNHNILIIIIIIIIILFMKSIPVHADEFDDMQVIDKVMETGAYDIIRANKDAYPYYLFFDYSIFNYADGSINKPTSETHRSYVLLLFSQPFQNGVYPPSKIGGTNAYNTHVGYLQSSGNRLSYTYNSSTDSWTKTVDAKDTLYWSACLDALLGANFNIYNEDGSLFFQLTSYNLTMIGTSVKRILLKPTVYLIKLATVSILLVITFRKVWGMLKHMLQIV